MSADLAAASTPGNLDEKIAQLMQCKSLSEAEVHLMEDLWELRKQKNANLVKVAKLNSSYAWHYMIVCARKGESDE